MTFRLQNISPATVAIHGQRSSASGFLKR